MKREKRLTKKERKALKPAVVGAEDQAHIHCIACGRHIDAAEFTASPPLATRVRCNHGSLFPSCVECVPLTKERLAEHDRTGDPVRMAGAWH
ncbi:MAG TPA: hypothetical protein VGM56_29710 [Byssovorax sp.]|jgi:hypothetical protein